MPDHAVGREALVDAVNQACSELATKLIEDIEALRSAVGPRVIRQPVYASLHPEETAEVARATAGIAEILTACMAEGRRLTPAEARTLEVLGRRRAELGIPLASVVGAIEQGAAAGHELLEQHAAAWPDARVALYAFGQMSRALFGAVHETTTLVTAGYRDEEQERATHLVREQATFVEDLLGGAWANSNAIMERGRQLGFPLTERCVLVLVLPETPRDAPKLKEATARFVRSLGAGAIVGPLRHGRVVHGVVLVARSSDDADDALLRRLDGAARTARVVALAEPLSNLADVAPTYETMKAEAPLAGAVTRFARILLREDLLEYRVLAEAGTDAVFDFIDAHLGPVLALDATEATVLVTTLEAVFTGGEANALVATRLHLSLSGLRYRLRRIAELTGAMWNDRATRYRLQLALHLFRLHEANLPALGEKWRPAATPVGSLR